MAGNQPKRLLLEAFVIVGSILLAFSIDAAWEGRLESQRRVQLFDSIEADVAATRLVMEERIAWAEDVAARATSLLEGISAGVVGAELDSLVYSVGNIFVKGYWKPINQTYEQALGSGDLALIEDQALRLLLGQYAESLENVRGHQESVVTQYYGQLEPYLVANTSYAQVAWQGAADDLVAVPFSTDARALAAQREFSNLLNLKLEMELEMIVAVQDALDLADRLLDRLASL